MSRIGPLYDLQQIDTGLDTRVARMRQIDEQMSDSPELMAARANFDDVRPPCRRAGHPQATVT